MMSIRKRLLTVIHNRPLQNFRNHATIRPFCVSATDQAEAMQAANYY